MTIGVILAGGQSRRMGGGDKCVRPLNGKPILQWIIDRARPQVSNLVLSANGDPSRFSQFGLEVFSDSIPGSAGPLAGILSGMEWARSQNSENEWIVTFPADAPFIPTDLVARFVEKAQAEDAQLVSAISAGRTHPVCGLWSISLLDELRSAMINEEMRKIDLWTARYRISTVEFRTDPVDPFFNINHAEELSQAEELARSVV